MVIRKAYLLDVDYAAIKDQTYVRLLLKSKDRKFRLYYHYDPYFYAEIPEGKEEQLLNMAAYDKQGKSISPKDVKIVDMKNGQDRKRVVKVICNKPSDVPLIRALIPFPCYEFNIPFGRRFIFDMGLTPLGVLKYEREKSIIKRIISCEPANPALGTLSFDIETYNKRGLPEPKADPAIMISWAGKSEGVLTTKKDGQEFVRTVDSEKAMLEEFTRIVKKEDPDILFGYNSSNFDLPYLAERARVNGADLQLGLWRSVIIKRQRGMSSSVKIAGRIHIDLYPMIRFFGIIGMIKTQDYTLDSISTHATQKKKKKLKKDDIWKLWDSNDIAELAEYSLVDSQVAKELGEKYLQVEMELASLAKLPLFDTALATSGQLVENLLMFHAAQRNELVPSKPEGGMIQERMANPIQGAFVKLPEPGVYDNIAVLDFKGLYPTIIVSYNIDPGTIVMAQDERPADDLAHHSPSGALFLKKPIGLIPFVLDYLIDFRTELKRKMKILDKDSEEYKIILARSTAIKVVSNSFYGYLGYSRSRWYNRECAESVTAYGRKHIADTISMAEKAGFNVLYADTDSVFLIYKNKDDVIRFMNEINESLPEKMELELEGFYPRGVFVSKKGTGGEKGAKKKYALLGEDGRVKIRGFELVRRDWSDIAKKTQRAVLEAILKEGSKEKAVKIVRETIERINSGKATIPELTIVTQLKKDPTGYEIVSPESSAAKKAIANGIPMQKGSIVSYVITKNGRTISEKAELADSAKDYDADYYVNNQVMPSVMKILKELGYDEYSMKVGGKQSTLGFFA